MLFNPHKNEVGYVLQYFLAESSDLMESQLFSTATEATAPSQETVQQMVSFWTDYANKI